MHTPDLARVAATAQVAAPATAGRRPATAGRPRAARAAPSVARRLLPTTVMSVRKLTSPLIVAGAALAAATLAFGFKRGPAPLGPPPKSVAVRRGPILQSVVATGRIEPRMKVEVKAKVSGVVTSLPFDTGDRVKEGEVIAELEKDVLQARVREAKARLAAAVALADQTRVGLSSAERDFARGQLDRLRQLKQDGLIAARDYDKAKADFDLAAARFESNTASQEVADAGVAQARALLEEAENQLGYATVVAPLDGMVLSRDIDVGSGVSGLASAAGFGTTLMAIGDVSELHVVADVDEEDVGKVRLGQEARVHVESFRDRSFPGTVRKIAPQGTMKDKVISFEIEVAVDDTGADLRPLMTADAEVVIAERADALLVPEAAVVREGERTFVQVPGAGEEGPRRVAVALGIGNGSEVEVTGGLAEGDLVVGP
jgi:HlyD family secretion protein